LEGNVIQKSEGKMTHISSENISIGAVSHWAEGESCIVYVLVLMYRVSSAVFLLEICIFVKKPNTSPTKNSYTQRRSR